MRSIEKALDIAGGGRNSLALVNNGFTGGDIENVINQVVNSARASGKDVRILNQEVELLTTCRNSLRGASNCIAGVVFHSSPTEGPGGIWNYTLRADDALGEKINVDSAGNDQEIYIIPLQHAVDAAIASANSSADHALLQDQVFEYIYTSITPKEREDKIRISFMRGVINYLAVAFFISMSGITYHLTGMMVRRFTLINVHGTLMWVVQASERESRLSQLIECMMPNRRRWEPQVNWLNNSFKLSFKPC